MRGLVIAVLCSIGGVAAASGQSGPQAVLVELFTSEGCSSCPPADALLRRLNGTTTPAGQLIVGIEEHVTYWNQLGWADPFSQSAFTERQSGYGDRFRLESVYTPQVVVNGAHQVNGTDRDAILSAAAKDNKVGGVALRIEGARVGSDGKTIAVTYSVGGSGAGHLDLVAVVADDTATSNVARGENSGRTLQHVAVARSLTKVAAKDRGTITLAVPALVKGQPPTKRHLILFVQESGLGKVLAVESYQL